MGAVVRSEQEVRDAWDEWNAAADSDQEDKWVAAWAEALEWVLS